MRIFNNQIYLDTFFKKGVKNIEDEWGVYCVTGFQGSGKNYWATFLLWKQPSQYKIKTNVKSLKINGRKIEYFSKINEITLDIEENCIYLIDEVSKKYNKNSKTDDTFYAWLQQSRKRSRIVIMITQEWKEVPMWLRRPVRYMYTTHKLGFLPLFVTTKGDALNQTYNIDTNEWECPLLMKYIYKRNKFITQLYDTFEPIQEL